MSKKGFLTRSRTETHCVGLSFERAAARRSALAVRRWRTTRTFASREVFSPTYTPPEKIRCRLYLRLRARTLRGFFDGLRPPKGSREIKSAAAPAAVVVSAAAAVVAAAAAAPAAAEQDENDDDPETAVIISTEHGEYPFPVPYLRPGRARRSGRSVTSFRSSAGAFRPVCGILCPCAAGGYDSKESIYV